MKKLLAMVLAAVMVLSLAACAQSAAPAATEAAPAATEAATAAAPAATTAAPAATEAAAPAEDPSETGHLTILWHQAGGTDGAFESMWYDYQSSIPDLMYDTLVKLDMEDNNKLVWRMADSCEASDDGLTYTFHLRDGMKWQDGTTVTPEDVVFSWEAKCAGAYPLSDDMTNVTYIEGTQDFYDGKAASISGITVNGSNITFKLTAPYNGFYRTMALTAIFPKHCFTTTDLTKIKEDPFWKAPVTCGPYKLVEVNFPDYCILERYDDWYGPKPGIKTVYGRSFDATGEEAAQNAMVAGEIDLAHSNGFNDINVANNICSQNPDYAYAAFPAPYCRYFSINQGGSQDGKNNPWMSNQKFRQAINKLIDKQAFAAYFPGQAVALSTMINPGDPLYDSSIPAFERDVEGAKALLAEIGYDGTPVRIQYYYADQTTMDLMDLAAQNLSEAGIPAEASLMTGDLTAAISETRNYDLLYGGLNAPSNADNYAGAGWITGLASDQRYGDVEYRTEFYNSRNDIVSASSDPAVIAQPLKEMQQQGLIDCYTMPCISMNKMFIYNDAKWDFDEAWLKGSALALYKCCDLRLETWKLNY